MSSAEEIRRAFLRAGGSATEAASVLGITRSAVYQALARADKRSPLTISRVELKAHPSTNRDDLDAIAAYVRKSLEAAGIQRDASGE